MMNWEEKMLEGMRLLQEGCDENYEDECVNCPFDKYCTALMDAELIDPFVGINFQKEDGEAEAALKGKSKDEQTNT